MGELVKLSNGIPVLIKKIDTVRSAAIGVYVKTGSKYEKEGQEGISHLLEHMLFKGTKKRSAKDISEDIDNIGGHINAFTSKEVTAFYVTIMGKYLEEAVDVIADIYNDSVFDEKELEKEKNVIIEEIRMYEDIPEDKVHDLNSEEVLKGCTCANSVLGTEESVKGISKEELIKYWKEKYTRDNMIISVAGDIDKNEILKQLEDKFGHLELNMAKNVLSSDFIINNLTTSLKKDTNQVHLCVNTKGISYKDDKRFVLSVLSNVLGGNMSSRLFQKIREDRGLAYSVYTYQSSYLEGGIFTVYAGTTKENYGEVIQIIKDEFEEIKTNGILESELIKVKNQLSSDMVLGLETTRSQMSRMANNFINYERLITVDEVVEEINKISLEEVKALAQDLFKDEYYSVTVLGDID